VLGFSLLLEYAYTARLSLNLANIQDVLSAATHVQMVNVIFACTDYLQSQIDLDNCVDIATIAETYSLKSLKAQVRSYWLESCTYTNCCCYRFIGI